MYLQKKLLCLSSFLPFFLSFKNNYNLFLVWFHYGWNFHKSSHKSTFVNIYFISIKSYGFVLITFINYFSHCCDQIPNKSNSGKERFTMAPSWRVIYLVAGYNKLQGSERYESWCSAHFLLCIQSRTLAHEIVTPTFKEGPLYSATPFWKCPQIFDQKFLLLRWF